LQRLACRAPIKILARPSLASSVNLASGGCIPVPAAQRLLIKTLLRTGGGSRHPKGEAREEGVAATLQCSASLLVGVFYPHPTWCFPPVQWPAGTGVPLRCDCAAPAATAEPGRWAGMVKSGPEVRGGDCRKGGAAGRNSLINADKGSSSGFLWPRGQAARRPVRGSGHCTELGPLEYAEHGPLE
jgi:hypothetical protein